VEKINIFFKQNSSDSTTSFKAIGELSHKEIKFKDNEDNLHVIDMNVNSIQYQKEGSAIMNFTFDLTKKTKGIYNIENTDFIFDIVTTRLINNTDKLEIEYKLFQDGELVNESILIIKYYSM